MSSCFRENACALWRLCFNDVAVRNVMILVAPVCLACVFAPGASGHFAALETGLLLPCTQPLDEPEEIHFLQRVGVPYAATDAKRRADGSRLASAAPLASPSVEEPNVVTTAAGHDGFAGDAERYRSELTVAIRDSKDATLLSQVGSIFGENVRAIRDFFVAEDASPFALAPLPPEVKSAGVRPPGGSMARALLAKLFAARKLTIMQDFPAIAQNSLASARGSPASAQNSSAYAQGSPAIAQNSSAIVGSSSVIAQSSSAKDSTTAPSGGQIPTPIIVGAAVLLCCCFTIGMANACWGQGISEISTTPMDKAEAWVVMRTQTYTRMGCAKAHD
mmetsp:Transcript_32749/g.90351  ORF Transcript_32749/g.90351 Transcript_32749/m.90351 type:complete len:333 (+) Transcript_32749:49-1047(+)